MGHFVNNEKLKCAENRGREYVYYRKNIYMVYVNYTNV